MTSPETTVLRQPLVRVLTRHAGSATGAVAAATRLTRDDLIAVQRQAQAVERRFAGPGLGLSIVKHIIELHRGSVEGSSEGEGKGATFTVRIPCEA